jgi:hypothetical protein
MLRKSLILGSMTLLLVMLFAFTGCEGPVGPAGPSGSEGRTGQDGHDGPDWIPSGFSIPGPAVQAVDLDAAFTYGNVVILQTGVETVFGKVPAGKILYVLGEDTKVAPGKVLAVDGTLNVLYEDSVLAANFVTAGTITAGENAVFAGAGAFVVPYVFGGEYVAGLHYKSEGLKDLVRYPGAAFDNSIGGMGALPRPLDSQNIKDIFEREELNELTVMDVSDLKVLAIPAGKTLTLRGKENKIGDNDFILSADCSLVIAANAKLTQDNAAAPPRKFETAAEGRITNNGEIVGKAEITAGNSYFINNGTIESSSTTEADIALLLAMDGHGIIKLIGDTGVGDVSFTGSPRLGQNLVLEPPSGGKYMMKFTQDPPLGGVTFDSFGKRTITLAKGANIELIAAATGVGTSVILKDDAYILTPTTSPSTLLTIFSEMTGGKLVSDTTLLGLESPFVIPPGIELELAAGSTNQTTLETAATSFAPMDITVDGTLTLSGSLSIGGNVISNKIGKVTVNGALNLGSGSLLAPEVIINGVLNTGLASGSRLNAVSLSLSSSDVSGEGMIVVDTVGNLTIDGVPGFGTQLSGIVGKDLSNAFGDIRVAGGAIKRDVVLGAGSSAYDKGIGTVAITSVNNAEKIVYKSDSSNNSIEYIELLPGISVYSGNNADSGFSVDGSQRGSDFKADVVVEATSTYFAIRDVAFTNTGSSVYTVFFNSVRFVSSGLIGSPLAPFYLAITSS